MLEKLKRMRRREHEHRKSSFTRAGDALNEAITALTELHECISAK